MQNWYGVKTFPGYENKVKENLEKLIKKDHLEESITEILIPTYKNYRFVRKEIKLREELIFPGYVFIKMNLTNEIMYAVRGVQYITGYSGVNNSNKINDIISEEEIQKMIQDSTIRKTDIEIGSKVKVLDGIEEYEATIKKINLNDLKITVFIEGQEKEFGFENIRKK